MQFSPKVDDPNSANGQTCSHKWRVLKGETKWKKLGRNVLEGIEL